MATAQRRNPALSLVTLLVLAPIFLSLTQCGGALHPPPLCAEKCGGVTCANSNECAQAAKLPVCAIATSGVCLSTGECAWKQNLTSIYCLCIEHDVRLCTASTPSGNVP